MINMRETLKMGLLQKLFGKKKSLDEPTKEKTINILVMGKAAVGKTSLINKLCDKDISEDHIPTLYENMIKTVNVEEYKVNFKFMELGATQEFPSMQELFIQQAEIYVLVYSADDVSSYHTLIELRKKIVSARKKSYSELPIIVVRNKIDIKRRRSQSEKIRKKSVLNWCVLHYDVSSKTGLRINSIMDNLIEESKFLGNKQDDEKSLNISGRYVYSGGDEEVHSELYHKAPGIFHTPDNSDEKMIKRRLRRQLSLRGKENTLKNSTSFSSTSSLRHSISLSSLRRSMRRLSNRRNTNNSLSKQNKSHSGGDVSQLSITDTTRQSTKPLEIRSNTLPQRLKTSPKSSLDVRSNTMPEESRRHSYMENSKNQQNLTTMNASDRRELFQKQSTLDPGSVANRSSLSSPQLRRQIPAFRQGSSRNVFQNDLSTEAERKTKRASYGGAEINKIDNSNDKTVSFHQNNKTKPVLNRQRSISGEIPKDTIDIPRNDILRNSPQIVRRSIPVRRMSSSTNNITDMFTIKIPVKQRKESSLWKLIKPNGNNVSNYNNSSQSGSTCKIDDIKRLSDSSKDKFDIRGSLLKLKDEKRHSNSSKDTCSLLDSPTTMKDITEQKRHSDSSKDEPFKETQSSSFDSKGHYFHKKLSPPKVPLSRRRSRSSCDVYGPSGTFGSNNFKKNSIYSNHSADIYTSGRASWYGTVSNKPSQPKSILKYNGSESTNKLPLKKLDSVSQNDLRNINNSFTEKINSYQTNSDRSSFKSSYSDIANSLLSKSTKLKTPLEQQGQQSSASKAKRWLQSVQFAQSVDEQ